MQKGEWTSARRRLAEANDVAQELQDDDLLEDLRRMQLRVRNPVRRRSTKRPQS
jgi:hypothetical protein